MALFFHFELVTVSPKPSAARQSGLCAFNIMHTQYDDGTGTGDVKELQH